MDPLVQMPQSDHPDAIADARADAAAAIRDLGHALVGHHSTVETLRMATTEMNRLVSQLTSGPVKNRSQERAEAGTGPGSEWGEEVPEGQEMTSYEERPISGRASPWGLEPRVYRSGDDVVAEVTLRAGHEGAPQRSHGGIVAALFDDILGFVLTIHHQPGFTGELKIRYEAGTPIGEPLRCVVRQDERQGRKLLMSGELEVIATGEIVARCTAIFIAIDPETFHALTQS
jgi:acyl-coenzyme A thioesterase PaaI-like protein